MSQVAALQLGALSPLPRLCITHKLSMTRICGVCAEGNHKAPQRRRSKSMHEAPAVGLDEMWVMQSPAVLVPRPIDRPWPIHGRCRPSGRTADADGRQVMDGTRG